MPKSEPQFLASEVLQLVRGALSPQMAYRAWVAVDTKWVAAWERLSPLAKKYMRQSNKFFDYYSEKKAAAARALIK